MIYGGFEIKSFEVGKGLWHARILRADHEPVVIDGICFPMLEVGFAWSDPEAAIAGREVADRPVPETPGNGDAHNRGRCTSGLERRCSSCPDVTPNQTRLRQARLRRR